MAIVVLSRSPCAAAASTSKASSALLQQLSNNLKGDSGKQLAQSVKGLIHFIIDGEHWALDLRPDSASGPCLEQAAPKDKADLTLTMTDVVFAQLVSGKLNPQTAFLMRKLKLSGSMGMAMKLQPVLDAAAPKAKL